MQLAELGTMSNSQLPEPGGNVPHSELGSADTDSNIGPIRDGKVFDAVQSILLA